MTKQEFSDILNRERSNIENEIMILVEKFESETSLKIDSIHIQRKNLGPEDGEIISEIEFKINL